MQKISSLMFLLCIMLSQYSQIHIHVSLWFQIVYDHDLFTKDDKMGEAEFDIRPFIETLKMNLAGLPNGTVITRTQPSRQNCLSEDSCIVYSDGNVVQDLFLRLKNVECGELEIQLQWITLPSTRGFWSKWLFLHLLPIPWYGQVAFKLLPPLMVWISWWFIPWFASQTKPFLYDRGLNNLWFLFLISILK